MKDILPLIKALDFSVAWVDSQKDLRLLEPIEPCHPWLVPVPTWLRPLWPTSQINKIANQIGCSLDSGIVQTVRDFWVVEEEHFLAHEMFFLPKILYHVKTFIP